MTGSGGAGGGYDGFLMQMNCDRESQCHVWKFGNK